MTRTGALTGCMLARLALGDDVPGAQQAPVTKAELDALWRRLADPAGRFGCTRTEETPDGPFYYAGSLARRSIAEGRPGIRLRLGIDVAGAAPGAPRGIECRPLRGAVVDVWQTDAEGFYSNIGPDLQTRDTTAQTFLRGHQITGEGGRVEFETIVPGWELVGIGTPPAPNAVAPHVHVKVFVGHKVLTTTLNFSDDFMDEVFRDVEPYKSRQRMTAPGLDRDYDRARNSPGARPVKIEHESGGVLANVTIALAESSAVETAPLFR